jgi:hypothetical protein
MLGIVLYYLFELSCFMVEDHVGVFDIEELEELEYEVKGELLLY